MTNWLAPNPFQANPWKPPQVGGIVRYVGSQHPELAGMEGIVDRIDGDWVFVSWKYRSGESKIPYWELKDIRQFSKRFR